MSDDDLNELGLNALKDVERCGGICKLRQVNGEDQTKVTTAIFVSTKKMIDDIDRHKPQLVLLDTTFGVCAERYKLAMFVYPCRLSNKTRVAAFCLMADEREQTVEFFLQEFANICQPSFFFVDKDFNQMKLLFKTWPSCHVFLCVFHVLKYMKSIIRTVQCRSVADLSKKKDELASHLRRVILAKNQGEFDNAAGEWRLAAQDCQFKQAGTLKDLGSFFENSWLSCHHLWATFHRTNQPLLFTNTTNRIESLFGKLKHALSRWFGKGKKAIPGLAAFAPFFLRFLHDRLFPMDMAVKRFRPIVPRFQLDMDQAGKLLTKTAAEHFYDQLMIAIPIVDQNVDQNNEETTTETNCSCRIYSQLKMPCHHILITRHRSGLSLFEQTNFPEYFHDSFMMEEAKETEEEPPIGDL